MPTRKLRFAVDPPVEGTRFELSVPLGLIVPACRDALPFPFALAKKVRLPKSSAARTARTRSEFMAAQLVPGIRGLDRLMYSFRLTASWFGQPGGNRGVRWCGRLRDETE
jgi:hypothetical protein